MKFFGAGIFTQSGRRAPAQTSNDRDRPPDELAEIRFARDVERLHRLGPRPLYELLTELGARHLIRQPIERLVRDYVSQLDVEVLRALGADLVAPAPLHTVAMVRLAHPDDLD
jgi:hypothetical protein